MMYYLCPIGEPSFCTSCDEYVDDTCRRNLGVCHPRYPDFACQTKEVYIQLNTGGEVKAKGGERDYFMTWFMGNKSIRSGVIFACGISIAIDLADGLGHNPSILSSKFLSIQ